MYTRMQKDRIQERRAIRGLAAAKRLLNEPRDAIRLLLEVLGASFYICSPTNAAS